MANKQNYGRSMVEMLAVLAIIGVLSIGGLVAYRMSMNKKRANDAYYDASMISAMVITREENVNVPLGGALNIGEYEGKEISGFQYYAQRHANIDEIFFVAAIDVPKGVCRTILNAGYPDVAVQVFDQNGNKLDRCIDNNEVRFNYDSTNSGSIICGNNLCWNGHFCQDGECACPQDMIDFGDPDNPCECKPGWVECNGACEFAHGCIGPDVRYNCETGQCECTRVADGFEPLADAAGNCVCPNGGRQDANGQCARFICTGSGNGNTYTCSFPGQGRCGTNCDSSGFNCLSGVCDAGICPAGTVFAYNQSLDLYGCLNDQRDPNTFCTFTRKDNVSSNVNCYDNNNRMCSHALVTEGNVALDGNNSYWGACGHENCPAGTTYDQLGVTLYNVRMGCRNDRTGAQCFSMGYKNKYICFDRNSNICGHGCNVDGSDCTLGNCDPDSDFFICPNGRPATKQGKIRSCTTGGLVCSFHVNAKVNGDGFNGISCARGKKNCGHQCDFSGNCKVGLCDPNGCPDGFTFVNTTSYSGCRRDTDPSLICYPDNYAQNSGYTCYKAGILCGKSCLDYNGTGCDRCTRNFSCPSGWTRGTRTYDNGSYIQIYGTCTRNGMICMENGVCFNNGSGCGSGCDLQGRNCASGVCYEDECEEGEVFKNNNCISAELNCKQNGSCTYGGSPCGSGCDEDGRNCQIGMCNADECPEGGRWFLYSFNGYACKRADGMVCYHDSRNTYACKRRGATEPCVTGCPAVALCQCEDD